MKAFVISLPDQHERRASVEEQLNDAGIAFDFFDAIRGDTAVHDCLFDGFDSDAFLLNTGRLAASGEIGCFASHREIWKLCAALGEPVMIMEDDFDLIGDFSAACRSADELIDQLGFIRLQTTLRSRERLIGRYQNFDVKRYTKAPHGLMCYCLSPQVAREFVAATNVIDAPVDVFTKKFWEHGRPMYALMPYSIAPSILSVDSTIPGRTKTRKSWPVAARRIGRKASWYWHRWIFNLRQLRQPALATQRRKQRLAVVQKPRPT